MGPLLGPYWPNKGHVKHSAVPLVCKVVSNSAGRVIFPGIFPDAGALERLLNIFSPFLYFFQP